MRGFLGRLFGKGKRLTDPIIIVSGLPRSGTSMMMAMLEAGGLELVRDGIRAADEDNPKGYYEFERVKDLDKGLDKSWLAATKGKGVKIISFLLQHLPAHYDYKIIFMHRNLEEVLASQSKMLVRRGEAQGEAGDEAMSRLFERHLRQTEALLARRQNCEVIYVEYRKALDSPQEIAERVHRFVGRELDLAQMKRVADRKLYRNRASH